MATPTFFLVGAPKAGTTSLFDYLGQHPDIGVSAIKEPCYFAPEVPVDVVTEPHRRDWNTYTALFASERPRKAIGEGSVAYLSSESAAVAIKTRVPDAKILMMLRDPSDRLFAHYSAARAADATTQRFTDWVATQQRVEAARSPRFGSVWAGNYATHLARFKTYFPDSQICISYYEDFAADADTVLRRIFQFLGVDADVAIDTSHTHNVTTVPRWSGLDVVRQPIGAALRHLLPTATFDRAQRVSRKRFHLTPSIEDRAHGIALYRHEIQSLSAMTGRNLTAWLTPEP